MTVSLIERLHRRCLIKPCFVVPGHCWVWTGALDHSGYGKINLGGQYLGVHRVAWLAYKGALPPADKELDHLCRNRACFNVNHLEVVTRKVNHERRAALITHCPAGHAYDDENTYVDRKGTRHCRACQRARRQSKRKEKQ